eukprot:53253-Pelagomonas_calceolata.AAC.2
MQQACLNLVSDHMQQACLGNLLCSIPELERFAHGFFLHKNASRQQNWQSKQQGTTTKASSEQEQRKEVQVRNKAWEKRWNEVNAVQ